MYNNGLELSVLVNGKPVKEIPSQGKVFVEARRGTQYTLKLKNNNHKRVMAIFSVDGVDVLKGKKAGDAEAGYVIEAYSSVEVKGYRINDSEVAQFAFTDTTESYSNSVGAKTKGESYEKTTRNNGVIGVRAIFEEAVAPVTLYSDFTLNTNGNLWITGCLNQLSGYSPGTYGASGAEGPEGAVGDSGGDTSCSSFEVGDDNANFRSRRMSAGGIISPSYSRKISANSSAIPQAPKFDAGTTWGQKVEDKVTKVNFNKSKEEFYLIIHYAFRESLIEAGIEVNPTKKIAEYPNPFESSEQYCKVPSGYRN